MKRILVLMSLLLVASFALPACKSVTRVNPHLEAIKQAGAIKVGTSPDYPPYESLDAGGGRVGFDIDLMEEAARRMGVRVEWVEMPFEALIPAVKDGRIDAAVAAFNRSEARDQVVDFTDAYYTWEDAFVGANSFAGTIAKPEDLRGHKIGVQKGSVQDGWLNDTLIARGGMEAESLFQYKTANQAVFNLKKGRFEILMLDYNSAKALVGKQQGLKILFQGALSLPPIHMVVPQGDAELRSALNEIIKQLKDEGFIDSLADQYFFE
jgi:polar amino acid transport system substrate-binding protein